jgi:hypothetical protein
MCIRNTEQYDKLPHDVKMAFDKLTAWEIKRGEPVTEPSALFFLSRSGTNGKSAWLAFVDWNAARGMKKSNRVRCRNYWVWRIRNVC